MQDFRQISQITGHVLPKDIDSPADQVDQQSLLQFWTEHVGIAAPHTGLLWYRSGHLVVFCDSPAWATQIRHQTPSLIRQLNEAGYKISSLKPKVEPVNHVFSRSSRKREKAKPVSAENVKAMKSVAAKLAHKGLREAFNRLADKSARR